MEKIKRLLLFAVLFHGFAVQAQDAIIVRKGLLSARATLSPSYMFANKQSYLYLHGNFEGYLTNKLSLAGEGYVYLGTYSGGNSIFDANHSLFFGISRHFTKGNNDVYLGIHPGVSIVKLNANENKLLSTQTGVSPVFSPVLGYNFYVNRFFHFFIQARMVLGQHLNDAPQNIAEFRFSAGLGFNVNAMKMNTVGGVSF